MSSSGIKYKESKNYKSLFLKIIAGQKWPWINKVFKNTVRTVFIPFRYIKPIRKWLERTPGGVNGKLIRLVGEKKFEEGYDFGLQWLKESLLKTPKPESVVYSSRMHSWQFAFNSVTRCAVEINREGSYGVLSELFEKGPEWDEGYPKVEAYYWLSQLAIKKENYEAAWNWIECAVKCDDSYAWAYHLRAWLGVFLKKGQLLEDLIQCLKNEPELKDCILKDELFLKTPNLLQNLNIREEEYTV